MSGLGRKVERAFAMARTHVEIGTALDKGQEAAVVESVKAASDVYAPAAGEVVEINEAIVNDPAIVNADPEKAGWFYKLKLADVTSVDGLMDEAAYKELIQEQGLRRRGSA